MKYLKCLVYKCTILVVHSFSCAQFAKISHHRANKCNCVVMIQAGVPWCILSEWWPGSDGTSTHGVCQPAIEIVRLSAFHLSGHSEI